MLTGKAKMWPVIKIVQLKTDVACVDHPEACFIRKSGFGKKWIYTNIHIHTNCENPQV